jgi:hypothetical protein
MEDICYVWQELEDKIGMEFDHLKKEWVKK